MLSYHQCQIRNDMYDKSFLIVFQYSVTSLSPLVPPPPLSSYFTIMFECEGMAETVQAAFAFLTKLFI